MSLKDALNESLRSGLLFGVHEEPLDAYGRRIVRVIVDAIEREANARTEELSLSERERVTIDNLIQLAQALNDAMGDGEEMPDGKVLLELPHDLLEGLVVLDDLPDDQPGFTLSGPAKARWALRRLLSPRGA